MKCDHRMEIRALASLLWPLPEQFCRDDTLSAPTLSSRRLFGHFRPKPGRDDTVNHPTASSRRNWLSLKKEAVS